MDEVFATNRAELCGVVTAPPRYSHESRGIRFYTFPLQTRRLSGTADTLNIVLRQSMLPAEDLTQAGPVRITGQLRSFNNKSGVGNRLVLTIYAMELAVQVNGKLKSTVSVPADAPDEAVVEAAKADPKVARAMEGMEIVKTIVVKNRLVNLILRPKK